MKLALAFMTVLFCFTTSHAMTLNNVVLGIDFTDGAPQASFPCSEYMGVVFCSKDLALEKNCASTLEISSESLACVTSMGEKVTFGNIDKKSYFEDFTNGGTGAYNVKYSSRVKLKEFKTPNGNTEYQIVVE